MSNHNPRRGLQLRSLIKPDGELELALHSVEVPSPGPTEVVVRVEAAPINPSDIGLLFGAADIDNTLATAGSGAQAKATARVPERLMRAMAGHFNSKQHLGFEFAAWYWHFVDVVWLFLFACIYVWGSGVPHPE